MVSTNVIMFTQNNCKGIQKWPKMGQNSIKSLGQRPKPQIFKKTTSGYTNRPPE